MSQLLKYLIVALICLILGSLLGILIYNHLSPVALLKSGLHTTTTVQDLAKEAKAGGGGGSGGADKKDAGKDGAETKGGDKKVPDKKDTDDKKEGAKDSAKDSGKEETKGGEDSTEYLRSLWPIKKRKAADVSGDVEGALYLDGTSPYGPPASYKEDLFSETKTLTLPGDPPSRLPPPLTAREKTEPLFPHFSMESSSEPPLPASTLYQVEIGRFSSLEKAQEAHNTLRSRGHEVDVYYSGSITNPDWFYVRLSALLNKPQAYRKAQTLSILEKIAPTLVVISRDVKKLPSAL
ncbi:MAG: hypothetical protein A2621_04175 [Alphaproteobacteria bacterium RIFCSPHIGHO2_01_FULL_41_14]|nr:MAG: hypothetical protein A2065_03920 [Alphaproteobacteria bacterium GWB1_45_5]OFW90044.1 MAG: hypothetical protein A2621_04175 [Alphaproteobacteria bacterium RIFCSPHIGHO2_01_FULL_41_14]